MAKLELELIGKNGDVVTYTQNRIPGKKLLEFWEMMADIEDHIEQYRTADIIGKKAEFVASLFDQKKVTAEAIIEGCNSWELVDTLDKLIQKMMGVEASDPKQSESVLPNLEIVT